MNVKSLIQPLVRNASNKICIPYISKNYSSRKTTVKEVPPIFRRSKIVPGDRLEKLMKNTNFNE